MLFNKVAIDPVELPAFLACGDSSKKGIVNIDFSSECYKQIILERYKRRKNNPDRPAKVTEPWSDGKGPAMWMKLHCMQNATPKMLADFTRKIPCGPCKKHWTELLNKYPVVYGEGFFAWTVMIHNEVNKTLSKSEMSLEQAIIDYNLN